MKYEIEIPDEFIPEGYEPVELSGYSGWFYESKEFRKEAMESRLFKLILRKNFDYGRLWDQLECFKAGTYFATDGDGVAFAFSRIPEIDESLQEWHSDTVFNLDYINLRTCLFEIKFPPLDWDKSLIRKPAKRDESWFIF